MRRRVILSLTAAGLLAACAHQGPDSATGSDMAWSLNQVEGEGLKLAYGAPQSDNVLMMLTCQPRSGEVLVSVNAGTTGDKPVLRLTSGRRSVEKPAEAGPAGFGDGVVVEASLPAADPVLASFAHTGDLAVSAGGQRSVLPKARSEAERFVSGCRT